MDSITIIYVPFRLPTLTYMGRITSELDESRTLPDDIDVRIELQ